MMGPTSFPGENQIFAKNIEPDTVYSIEKNKYGIHIASTNSFFQSKTIIHQFTTLTFH